MGYNFPDECFQRAANWFLHMWWSTVWNQHFVLVWAVKTWVDGWYNCQLIWIVCCLKKDQNTEIGNMKSYFFMTMLHHIRQKRLAARWKHSAGKFYPTHLTHQAWLLPTTTCLHWWGTHLLSSALVHTKMSKNCSMNGSRQKGKIFTLSLFINFPKNGENV